MLKSEFNYTYTVLKAQHAESTIKMFTRAFCDSEPMTRYVDMQYEEFTPFATLIVDKAVKDGLSSIVVKDNDVIACALVEDLLSPLDIQIPLTPKFGPIFNLLENLSASYFSRQTFHKNQVAHLFITAVHNNYRGQGLSEVVNFGAMDIAEEKKFEFMTSELTNYINEEGLIKYLSTEKQLINTIIYKDFIFENKKPFENLAGAADSYIWALKKGVIIP